MALLRGTCTICRDKGKAYYPHRRSKLKQAITLQTRIKLRQQRVCVNCGHRIYLKFLKLAPKHEWTIKFFPIFFKMEGTLKSVPGQILLYFDDLF